VNLNRMQLSRGVTTRACALGILLAATGIAHPQAITPEVENARIERVIGGLRPSVAIKGQPSARWTLAERMASSHVPAVSVAVIDKGKIAWARGFGVKEADKTDPVTTSTLFEAQSISKAITATAALALVSSGHLSLDTPVNTYLKPWKIPDNEYQTTEKVTLRRILCHTSGLTVGGFAGYRSGDSIPTLLQVLNGEKPANNPPIRVDFIPGSKFRYSGGGIVVLQQLLIDQTGLSFPDLMNKLVLTPTGMTRSTFEQPLPEARWADAVSGHDSDGKVIKGRWPIHPEMAAAGLWTTPTDLAKWALQVTAAWKGQGNSLFSKTIATDMLSVQMEPYGLGVELRGAGPTLEFSHAGSNSGFRAMVVMFPTEGKGAVIMANGDGGDAIIGQLLTSIAMEYQWPSRTQVEREVIPLSVESQDAIMGVYSLRPGPSGEKVTFEVTRKNGTLFGQIKGLGPRPPQTLFPSNPTSFFTMGGMDFSFTLDSSGRAINITFGDIVGTRIP